MQLSKNGPARGVLRQEREQGVCPLTQMSTDKRQTGGPERDRTADLLRAKQALSQLSYRPMTVQRSGRAVRTSKSKQPLTGASASAESPNRRTAPVTDLIKHWAEVELHH